MHQSPPRLGWCCLQSAALYQGASVALWICSHGGKHSTAVLLQSRVSSRGRRVCYSLGNDAFNLQITASGDVVPSLPC